MSPKSFVERFPSFKSSSSGKAVAESLKERYRGKLRALVTAEDQQARGEVQLLQRQYREFFGIDLLE